MIVPVAKRVTVEETWLHCTECGAQFKNTPEGITESDLHAKTHEPLRYLHPGNKYIDTVWVDEKAVIRKQSPWRSGESTEINHANRGLTHIDWEGPGWYVFHEYETWFRGGRETKKEFIHVDEAYQGVRDKISDLAGELRWLREIKNKERP